MDQPSAPCQLELLFSPSAPTGAAPSSPPIASGRTGTRRNASFPMPLPCQSSINALGCPDEVLARCCLADPRRARKWSPQSRRASIGWLVDQVHGLHVGDEGVVIVCPLLLRVGVWCGLRFRATLSPTDVWAMQRGLPKIPQPSGFQVRPEGPPPAVALLQHRIEAVALSRLDLARTEPGLQV